MRSREENEKERENALWRITIYRLFQRGELEELIDLKEGPECLDDEIEEMLDKCIAELENKQRGRSQAE